jgi:uncharacterized protein (TIGR03118 family)
MKIITTALIAATMSAALSAQTYSVTKLVSNTAGVATFTDPNLINPWGLAASGTDPWWVSDNNSGLSTLYNGEGQIQSLVVAIPPGKAGGPIGAPSGIVANNTTDFGGNFFIFDTEDGTIQGWNGASSATIILDNGAAASYKGLTMGQIGTADVLYAADFFTGKVEVYNTDFKLVTLPTGAFTDSTLPAGFAPFNVQNIGGDIFVTFAEQDSSKLNEVNGAGLGYVDKFNSTGKLLLRLAHGSYMNAPWGIALAGSNFGTLSGDLLVGNFGSGAIIAFNATTGAVVGPVMNSSDKPITIPGLWALAFGQGGNNGPSDWLYFTAGGKNQTGGLFGFLAPN